MGGHDILFIFPLSISFYPFLLLRILDKDYLSCHVITSPTWFTFDLVPPRGLLAEIRIMQEPLKLGFDNIFFDSVLNSRSLQALIGTSSYSVYWITYERWLHHWFVPRGDTSSTTRRN